MNLKEYLKRIDPVDLGLEARIQQKLDNLTKPAGSLGRLEDIAKQYCLIRKTLTPCIERKVIFTLAGDHGVTEEGISAYPQDVTHQMLLNFMNGGAGINVLAGHVGAEVVIADMGVNSNRPIQDDRIRNLKINNGTKNIVKGPAMSSLEAEKSILSGISLVEGELGKGLDIIGTGDMGIGNTTSSSAIVSVITGEEVEKVTGRGTGINDDMLYKKIQIIKKAIELNKPDREDPVDILAKVGGYEIGGIAGIIIAGAANSIPVVIDGFISGAAALIAYELVPGIKDYLIASHSSVEQGHKIVFEYLQIDPLLDLKLRLGEGTGAALGMTVVEGAVKVLNEMATFKQAGVSQKE